MTTNILEYNYEQLNQITIAKEQNLEINELLNPNFSLQQMLQIRKGLEQNLDVSVYADPNFDCNQMREIKEGLEIGIDVSIYANPEYNEYQMIVIRLGLEHGIDANEYANPQFNYSQMEQLRYGLEDGLDVRVYANEKFDATQMEEIRFQMIDDERNSTYKKSIECVDYLKNALAENFDGKHLNGNIIESATDIYGEKVLKHVLIHAIWNKSYDGRINQANKDWASDEFAKEPLYEIPETTFIIGDSSLENILVNKYREIEHENQIKAKEPFYLDILENSEKNTYAIYQIKNSDELRNYRLSTYRDLESRNLKLDKDNYNLIYASVEDTETNTLDKIYLKFNVNSPENYLGHSLSISDIIATKKDGEISYNYVNRDGFKEIENFVGFSSIFDELKDVIKEQKTTKYEVCRREQEFKGWNIDLHEGMCEAIDDNEEIIASFDTLGEAKKELEKYTSDSEKIEDKQYFLLEHEEYVDEAANIIVDEQGKLVLDYPDNFFDDLKDFFEENNLNENSSKLTALLIEPMKAPVVVELENELESLQNAVDGNIEIFNYYENICLICNEEGKINGSQLNRAIYDEDGEMVEIIVGSFLVVGNGEEDFISLSPKLIEKYKNKFEKPEKFTKLAGKIIAQKIDLEPKKSNKPKSNDIDR